MIYAFRSTVRETRHRCQQRRSAYCSSRKVFQEIWYVLQLRYVNKNTCLIVDTSKFSDWRDVKQDLVPGMAKNKTKKLYFEYEDGELQTSKATNYDYIITRMVYGNKDHKDFHKVILYVTSKSGKQYPLVFLQYYFDGNEHEITSISGKHHTMRALPSMVAKIKEYTDINMRGKKIYHKILEDAGWGGGGGGRKCPVLCRYSRFVSSKYMISQGSIVLMRKGTYYLN